MQVMGEGCDDIKKIKQEVVSKFEGAFCELRQTERRGGMGITVTS